MSTMKACVAAVIALSTLPILLSAQKPAKPPKPGPGTPPNPAIAYEALGGSGYHDLMVMDANGQNQTRLVRGGNNMTPSWSPDGEWIAFARTSMKKPGIYMIRRDGTGLCSIAATTSALPFGAPTWSPNRGSNGRYTIVYVDRALEETRTDLFAVDAVCGATNSQRLTSTSDRSETWPAWGPDGVLAATEQSSNGDIVLYDTVLDSLGGLTLNFALNLTNVGALAGGDVFGPLWTQSGTHLVVSGSSEVRPDLWLLAIDSPGISTRLNDTPALLERRPTWSPDFKKLAYDANGIIYEVDVDTTAWTLGAPRILLASERSVGHPSWRPVQ